MSKQGIKPDIFICGVMKGGTTILHDYICAHPEVEAGVQKEIHYFSLFYHQGEQWYQDHFNNVTEGKRTIDASPTYFDATNTALIPRLIKGYTSDPRVIIITRDPIERAISQFIHLKVTTKVEALAKVDIDEFFQQDLAAAYRQTTAQGYYLNQVLGFSLYSRKYITYRDVFSPEQLLVLDNASLREDAGSVMRSTYEFLGLPFVDSDLFGVVKYSNGSGINKISLASYNRLAELLYPDYERYCELTGTPFRTLPHDSSNSQQRVA